MRRHHSRFATAVMMAGLAAAAATVASRRQPAAEPTVPPPPMLARPLLNPWKEAARRVEEDRGQPSGRSAKVSVPPELRHYDDRRRFLALQVAASREQDYDLPHDWAELVEMIHDDQLAEMEPLGEGYILYGVGGSADDGPFTHFDRRSGAAIPLYDGWADFQDADLEMRERIATLRSRATGLRASLRKVPTRFRQRRRGLLREAQAAERSLAALERRRKLVASFYEDYDRRRQLVREYRLLGDAAADFGGRSYDLGDPRERLRLKGRLLSFLRPEARAVLLQLARSYEERFGRPLPITSLVRTLRYQQRLGETNPNAARVDAPPHATGLAFDIYYRYMTADEQGHIMSEIAALESASRLEALRENLDHIHVFVFPDGRRPAETLVAVALKDVGDARGRRPGVSAASRRAPAARPARAAPPAGGRPAPPPRP